MESSKEHIWGKWLQSIYPRSEIASDATHFEDRNNKDGTLVVSDGFFAGKTHPYFRTSKVVCNNCNNTWMSSIEKQMKSVFVKIFQNGKQLLSQEEHEIIRNWCFLKFCVQDFSVEHPLPKEVIDWGMEQKLTEVADRARNTRNNFFYLNKKPPSDYKIFVGRTLEPDFDGYSYTLSTSPAEVFPSGKLNFNEVKTFIGVVGHMHFFVSNHIQFLTHIRSFYFRHDSNTPPLIEFDTTQDFVPLAALHPRDLEEKILSFFDAHHNLELRRNFVKFDGIIQNIRPRDR